MANAISKNRGAKTGRQLQSTVIVGAGLARRLPKSPWNDSQLTPTGWNSLRTARRAPPRQAPVSSTSGRIASNPPPRRTTRNGNAMSCQNIPQPPQSNSVATRFVAAGVNSNRGTPHGGKQGVLPVCVMHGPLAIAQQPPRDFLTAERLAPLASKGRECPRTSSRATRAEHPGRENLVANAIITLTTDYGTDDHLVGTVKGVILKINPGRDHRGHHASRDALRFARWRAGHRRGLLLLSSEDDSCGDCGSWRGDGAAAAARHRAESLFHCARQRRALPRLRTRIKRGGAPRHCGTLFSPTAQQDVSRTRCLCASGGVALQGLANSGHGRRDSGLQKDGAATARSLELRA